MIFNLLTDGTIDWTDLCWREGWEEWKTLESTYPKPQPKLSQSESSSSSVNFTGTVNEAPKKSGFLFVIVFVVLAGSLIGLLSFGLFHYSEEELVKDKVNQYVRSQINDPDSYKPISWVGVLNRKPGDRRFVAVTFNAKNQFGGYVKQCWYINFNDDGSVKEHSNITHN
jgi:hypothetical protein